MIVKRKRVHAGFSREEWRRIKPNLPVRKPPCPFETPPRSTPDILVDLAFQLETLWNRFPREFVK